MWNAVSGILEELSPAVLRIGDALLALHAEFFVDAAASCDELDQCRRAVRIELIGDQDPAGEGVGLDAPVDLGVEVRLGLSRPNRRADDLARHGIEIRDQRKRPVADVLELDPFNETGADGLGFMNALKHWLLLRCGRRVLQLLGRFFAGAVGAQARQTSTIAGHDPGGCVQ